MADRLRGLWDFGDLDGSEERLRAQLAAERSEEGRAEVLTQLARVEGLRGEFEAGERLVEEAAAAAGDSGVAAARVDLERGRLRRSSGDREAALPLFEAAFSKAEAARAWFVAADAAHMAALAAPGRDGFVAWTARGIELGDEHEDAAYWAGPLLNNLGWEHFEAGEHELALDAFERALAARLREPDKPEPIALARYAVGKALRALGRADEGIPLLEAGRRVGRVRGHAGRLVPRGAGGGVRGRRPRGRRPAARDRGDPAARGRGSNLRDGPRAGRAAPPARRAALSRAASTTRQLVTRAPPWVG